MRIKRILLQNIRSYDIAEIEFPDGNVLLSGDIGAGKSSILLGIEFAIFGLPRGIKGSYLLRNGQDVGGVKLEFEIDGKEIKVERKLKRVKESIRQDLCFIEIDGKKEQLSSTELKSRMLGLLKYPQEFMSKNPILYKYTVYTPQEEMKSILTENPVERLNTLRRVFGIDKYKRVIENISIILSRVKEQIKEKEGRVADLSERKEDLRVRKESRDNVKKEIGVLRERFDEISEKVLSKEGEVKVMEGKLKEANKLKTDYALILGELKTKKEQQENNLGEIKRLSQKIKEAEERVNEKKIGAEDVGELSNEVKKKELELNVFDKRYLELAKLIAGDEANKMRLQRIVGSVTSLDNCPTCKQKVGGEHKCKIKEDTEKEISEIDGRLVKGKKEKFDLDVKKKSLIEGINGLRERDREFLKIKGELENIKYDKQSLQRLELTGEQISKKVDSLSVNQKDVESKIGSFKDLDEGYSSLRKDLEVVKEEQKGVEINKARSERQLEDLESVIIKFEDEIEKKLVIMTEIAKAKQLKDWISKNFISSVGEIEKTVMNKVHLEFSELFGKWFSMLAEGLSARINEEFTPVIEQQGYELLYSHLSGGERTAAALAYRLALNQVINSLMSEIKTRDLMILDEPTEGFSFEQLDKMRDVLQELKVSQLILVSHETKIESFVDKIIRFHKDEVTKVV